MEARIAVLLMCMGVLVLTSSITEAAAVKDHHGSDHCRCVPDQWEGLLSSFDREFDLRGGRSSVSDTSLIVHYDYENRLFAMTDMRTGSSALADYAKGYKYVIRGDSCQGMRTDETMRRMCLPDGAELNGHFHLGTDIPVDVWEFDAPYNVSMKTVVLRETCIPVSEEVYMAKGSYASVTSSMYLDVSIGISDRSVFTPPAHCMVDLEMGHGPPPMQPEKRDDEAPSVLKALRNRLYNFN